MTGATVGQERMLLAGAHSERVIRGMKRAMLTVAVGLEWVVLVTPNGVAGQSCPLMTDSGQSALLTIKALHMFNQPVGTTVCYLAYGPIWDGVFTTRRG